MHFIAIAANIRFQDVLDILFLTIVAYHLYLWFRGTKAFKALAGLSALGIVFTVARSWGLFLTTWMFQILWQVLIILLIILFQSEIRQVLERVNPLHAMGLSNTRKPVEWIDSIVHDCFSLAKRSIGALIIIERTDRVDEFVTGGVQLEGKPSRELLLSIFHKESPLHDGAALIRSGSVALVASYLPLSSDEGLPKKWGTRHRAALGLSERCDAWVVVVSEERAEVSLARSGEMIDVKDREHLHELLHEAIRPPTPEVTTWQERVRLLLLHRWRLKLGVLGLVTAIWLMFAGQQDFEVTLDIPVELRNLPEQMQIIDPIKPKVKVVARGLRKDASTLSPKNVHAELDLSLARLGRRTFRISRHQIDFPSERIDIVKIEPSQFYFKFDTE